MTSSIGKNSIGLNAFNFHHLTRISIKCLDLLYPNTHDADYHDTFM
ncbi:hypothetical protein ATHSA_p10008 (plasmid) [Athalassotoga saccharophila]|uniref:Uncharacterized protein n=1 Tax=Athalassotoga saccharophila TaxID=1441386 RepID=A0A6N4TEX1_9BACT|nr:hypothetical protein ATHSA_p10008 [Athalassotoga saccharophila]